MRVNRSRRLASTISSGGYRTAEGTRVSAGLDDIVDYILNLRFTEDDLAYLDGLGLFPKEVIKYLEDFRFTGDLWAMPEGTVVFPQEPVIRVTAPLPQAQLIETPLLNMMNFQTLIATKASRARWAAGGGSRFRFRPSKGSRPQRRA